MNSDDVIATLALAFAKDDERKVGSVEIGKPYLRGLGDWRCPVTIKEIEDYPDIAGANSFQALSLAMQLVRNRITTMSKEGWSIFLLAENSGEPSESPFNLENYF